MGNMFPNENHGHTLSCAPRLPLHQDLGALDAGELRLLFPVAPRLLRGAEKTGPLDAEQRHGPSAKCGWVDGWMGGWVDGWMGGWVGGWAGGRVGLLVNVVCKLLGVQGKQQETKDFLFLLF